MLWLLLFLEFWSDHIQFVSPHLQAPSAYSEINAMPSVRKRLSMALGLNGKGSSFSSNAAGMDMNRKSIDSGYHSMIAKSSRGSQDSLRQETTFISPEHSPRKLHKAISTTFSGAIKSFSDTVRSTTSYIYPTPGEIDLPSSEWAECETPKNKSRRPSIKSSFRSRKQQSTPRTPGAKIESPERLQSNVPVTQEKAPALDVDIPNPSFNYESLERVSVPCGSELLVGVKLPAGPKNLWPGPTRLTVHQASENGRGAIPHPVATDLDDPYVETGYGYQHSLSLINSPSSLDSASPEAFKRYRSDEKCYVSDMESNANVSGSDERSPVCLKYVAPGSPEAKNSSPCRYKPPAASHTNLASVTSPCERKIPFRISSPVPSGPETSKSKTLDGIAKQRASPESPSRRCKPQKTCLNDDLNALSPPSEAIRQSKTRALNKRLMSDIYNADAESLDSSMGSRAAWERHRADRERRYTKIVDMIPDTESDEELESELDLKRSPSKRLVHYAKESVQGTVKTGKSESTPRSPTGDLCYAVEAIERRAFPVGNLARAIETSDTPSAMSFEPLETMLQQRPLLGRSDTVDEPETLRVSDALNLSVSRGEIPWSPLANLSPSQVDRRFSPDNSTVDTPAAPKFTMVTMKLTCKGPSNFRAGSLDVHCSGSSLESTSVSAKSSRKQQSNMAPNDAEDPSLKAGEIPVSTHSSNSSKTNLVGEDACQAGLRAPGISMPTCPSDVIHEKSMVDSFDECELETPSIFKGTRYGTYRDMSGARYTPPKQRCQNDTAFMHSRMVSTFSNSTDVSCDETTQSLSCNDPPPFPCLHVGSEPARSISSAFNASGIHGEGQIRISRPANVGINLSLPSPFDGPKDQLESTSTPFSTKASHCADLLEENSEVSSSSPSPGTKSSLRSPENSSNTQQRFNAARLPNFESRSPIGSRKDRRKKKKSSQLRSSTYLGSDESWLDDFVQAIVGEDRWPTVRAKSSKKSPGGKGEAGETSLVRSSPRRMRLPARVRTWSAGKNENGESADQDSQSRLEPEFNDEHSGSTGDDHPSYTNRRLGSTSYAGYELNSVFNEDLQQDKSDRACSCEFCR